MQLEGVETSHEIITCCAWRLVVVQTRYWNQKCFVKSCVNKGRMQSRKGRIFTWLHNKQEPQTNLSIPYSLCMGVKISKCAVIVCHGTCVCFIILFIAITASSLPSRPKQDERQPIVWDRQLRLFRRHAGEGLIHADFVPCWHRCINPAPTLC